MKAVVIDKDYGSVHPEDLVLLQDEYKQNGITLELYHCKTPEEIVQVAQGAEAILCTGNPPVTAEVVEALPDLKLIQRFGIGVNSIDLEAARKAGVLVLNIPGFCVQELATHAAALILGNIRNIGFYDRGIRAGEWRKAQGPLPPNPAEMVLGLYGFGGSARPLYRIFHEGFGTKVITCDPFLRPDQLADYAVELVDFDTLLASSDVLSIHAPLTKDTYHVFNWAAFAKMKPSAMLINIARGELVDERALVEALREGKIRSAGLDVFAQEPLPKDHPLTSMEQVTLTCHSAFYGKEAQQNQRTMVRDLVQQVLLSHQVEKRYVANAPVQSRIRGFQIIG